MNAEKWKGAVAKLCRGWLSDTTITLDGINDSVEPPFVGSAACDPLAVSTVMYHAYLGDAPAFLDTVLVQAWLTADGVRSIVDGKWWMGMWDRIQALMVGAEFDDWRLHAVSVQRTAPSSGRVENFLTGKSGSHYRYSDCDPDGTDTLRVALPGGALPGSGWVLGIALMFRGPNPEVAQALIGEVEK